MQDKDYIRALTTPLCVVLGVAAVIFIFNQVLQMMPSERTPEVMKEATSVAGTAIAMIGTLVGFVTGQAVGASGKEKAEDRASNAMEQAMTAERRAGIISGMAPSDVVEQARQQYPDLFK